MNEKLFLLLLIVILVSKEVYIYCKYLQTKDFFHKNGNSIKEIEIDSESIIFLTPTPTNNINYLTSLPKDFTLKYIYSNFFTPKLDSIIIYYKEKKIKTLIGIILLDNDIIVNNIQLSLNEKKLLLLSKEMKKKIVFEVCNKLRRDIL